MARIKDTPWSQVQFQWSHDLSIMETGKEPRDLETWKLYVSMEPRSFDHGDRRGETLLDCQYDVSMEPRSFDHGDAKSSILKVPHMRKSVSMEPRSFDHGDSRALDS